MKGSSARRLFPTLGIIAALGMLVVSGPSAAATSSSFTVTPWQFACGTTHNGDGTVFDTPGTNGCPPGDTAGSATSTLTNGSLFLQKNAPTTDDLAAGASIGGLGSGVNLTQLDFDITGACTAGSPRWNIVTADAKTHFYGCMANNVNGHVKVDSNALLNNDGSGNGGIKSTDIVTAIDLVADESGSSTLTNIVVTGTPAAFTGGPDVSSWGSGHLDLFARGSDNALWQRTYDAAHGGWTSWTSLGGILTSDPSATSWGPGHIDVFVRGQDNALWQKTYDAASGGWGGWVSRGGTLNSGPDAASWTSGRLDVFALGRLNDMWHRYFDAAHGGWGSWESVGGSFTSDPGVASWGPGRLDIFARDPQTLSAGLLMHKYYDSAHGGWGTWGSVPGSPGLNSGPDASSWGTGRLDAFAQDTGNATQHVTYQGGWSAWESLAGSSTSDPGAVSWGRGRIDVFVRAADNTIVHRYFANGAWSAGWTPN